MFFSEAKSAVMEAVERCGSLRQRLIGKLGPGEVDPYVDMKSRRIIPAISEAIDWFRRGGYGICKDCGERIPEQRLKLVPAAARCVECQEEKEKDDA